MSNPDDFSKFIEFENFIAKIKDDPDLEESIKEMDHEALSEIAKREGFNQAALHITENRWNADILMSNTCTRNVKTNLKRGI